MTLENLALFFIGAGLPYLTTSVLLRLFGGRSIDDDVETPNKEQPFKGHYESREFIGYVAVSIGVLLYIAYILLRG